MLAELRVKGVEIEPHLCYYRKRGVQEHSGVLSIKSNGKSRFNKDMDSGEPQEFI